MLMCSAIMMMMLIVCISVACLVCAVVGATHHLKYSDRSIGKRKYNYDKDDHGACGVLEQAGS